MILICVPQNFAQITLLSSKTKHFLRTDITLIMLKHILSHIFLNKWLLMSDFQYVYGSLKTHLW
jgi:hypothetical protein